MNRGNPTPPSALPYGPAGRDRQPFPPRPNGLGTSAARIAATVVAAPEGTHVTPPRTPTASSPRGHAGPAPASRPAASRSASRPGPVIPALHCPEPVRVDEGLGAEVNERLVAWVERVGIFPGRLDFVRRCDYGRYAMLIHPDTDDPDRLLLAAQCMAALFAVDDCYCDDERTGSDTAVLGNRLTLAQTALDPAYLVGPWGYQDQLGEALRGTRSWSGCGPASTGSPASPHPPRSIGSGTRRWPCSP